MSIFLNKIYKKIDDFTLDIDLQIEPGELVSLLGPSGCGKTTTLRIIAGFEEPDRGSVSINNQEISHLPPEKRNIGMVFQDYALFPHMTVYENIAYGPVLRKWDKQKIDLSVQSFLKIVHLEGFGNRKVTNLSGGEQQRVALARALITEPKLLLLDEPLSALDAKLRKKLRREIRKIQKELSITTIYVTHDQEEALAISDKIAVMNEGQCIQYDNPHTLYRQPIHVFSAGFIGNSNIIEIEDYSGNAKQAYVKTAIGVMSAHYHCEDSLEKKYLFFRPDNCIPAKHEYTENVFTGIIVDEEYSGTHTSIDVLSNGVTIKALLDENCLWKIGDEISLHVNKHNCRILS